MAYIEEQLRDNDTFLRATFRRHLLPAILSVAGVTISTMANSLIASNLLGHKALAVMSIVSPVYFLFATVGALLGVGGSSMAAWSIGQEDTPGANRAFTQATLLALGISLSMALAGLIMLDPFLTLLGAEGDLLPLTRQYTQIFLLGGVGTTMIYIPFNFLKLEGRLKLSVSIFVFMAALNIGLDFFFVLVMERGIVGIALGTSVAALTAAVLGMISLLGRWGTFRLCAVWGSWRSAGKLMVTGSPASLNNLATTARTICLNLILTPLAGTIGLSAFSIVTTAANLALTVISGVGQTTAPFIGVFTKEKDNASIRQLERRAVYQGLALILPITALFVLFAQPFCGLFGIRDPQVLEEAVPAVALFALSLPPSMLSTILLNYYLASGYTGIANLITACRAFAFVVLPACLLAPRFGMPAVWLSFTAAELLTWAVLAIALLVHQRKHPNRKGLFLLDRRYEDAGQYISFAVHSTEDDIVQASTRISDFCDQNHLDARQSMLISLALEEMLISIRDHCFASGPTQEMNVRILILSSDQTAGDETIVLRIRCSGTPFNPIDYYKTNRRENPDEFDDSVGIQMIVKSALSVDYKSTFGVNNLTILL
ncbi:MAG: hypothetical protein HFE97_09525 [Oscillospiraceae bacterium]|nr:hypothetical protein [Oscillospiraceae bacterium]